MPLYFRQPCKYPSCHCYALPGHAYCAEHYRAVTSTARRQRTETSSAKQGYNNAWRKASKAFLKEHPLCAECERQGKLTPATEVDHIKAHKGDMDLFWNVNNWQPLCHRCHSRKTVREDGGFMRAQTPRGSQKR